MPVYSADLLLTAERSPVRNGWVKTDESGKILATGEGIPDVSIQLKGILIPGFVNTHCHLELSFLRGRIAEKTGMTGFIKNLLKLRNQTQLTDQARGMQEMVLAMQQNGIVATGDISNTGISAHVKKTSAMRFHTFIEVFGMDPSKADEIISGTDELVNIYSGNGNSAGLTPHAPYSMSKSLIEKLCDIIAEKEVPLSIHLHESEDELLYCRDGSGPMGVLFNEMGFHKTETEFNAATPVHYLLPMMKKIRNVIFVHNTYITADEIQWAEEQHQGIYWCLCPKANLYITDKLPPADDLHKHARHVCIGTDSLASNDTLSILEELKILSAAFPSLPFHAMIEWATLNGARALQMDESIGSITEGKTPGLNLLQNINPENPVIDPHTTLVTI